MRGDDLNAILELDNAGPTSAYGQPALARQLRHSAVAMPKSKRKADESHAGGATAATGDQRRGP